MSAHQAEHRITTMSRLLGVSTSGYYAWKRREPSARAKANEQLLGRIRTHHVNSDGNYGSPRILKDLRAEGLTVGQKRVARLMRRAGLVGVSRRKGCWTTVRDRHARPAPDLVQRTFVADAPNKLWVADITYVPTWTGFLYLSVVLDVFSRRIVAPVPFAGAGPPERVPVHRGLVQHAAAPLVDRLPFADRVREEA